MKNLFLFGFFCCSIILASAQYKVHFVFEKLPAYHNYSDTIFVGGSFNSWNPRGNFFSVAATEKEAGITIDLPANMFEYKFTRGSWEKVESGAAGMPVMNRQLQVFKDTTILINIEHWADRFEKKKPVSTASKNVHLLDSAFYMPQLDRYRRIWIYLPASYHKTRSKKYPVLYMHDGQNVFDNATAGFGEWGVDEMLDSVGASSEVIVVAVDHGGEKRINEYAPFNMKDHGKGEGDAYADFLANTLLPFINNNYRTKKQARFTAVAGSSMGGLISLYTQLKYPNKFGAAGVFSPAFWIVPQLKAYVEKRAAKAKGALYFYAGGQESKTMVSDMLSIAAILKSNQNLLHKTHVRPEGKHNEPTWQQEFPLFFNWWQSTMKKEKD